MARWLKVREDLPEDPKTIFIANKLRLSIDTTVGKLIRLWIWANRHAKIVTHDAVTQFVQPRFVDDYVSQAGFVESLVAVGWIVVIDNGLKFVNFVEHNWPDTQDDRRKELAAERSRRYRERKRATVTQSCVTHHAPSCDESRLPNLHPTKEEKDNTPLPPKGGKERKEKPPEVVSIPHDLNTPEFAAAWERWLAYRRERRQPLKPASQTLKLRELAEMGPARAIAAIDHSIAEGYQGLFEPKGSAAKSGAQLFDGIKEFLENGGQS